MPLGNGTMVLYSNKPLYCQCTRFHLFPRCDLPKTLPGHLRPRAQVAAVVLVFAQRAAPGGGEAGGPVCALLFVARVTAQVLKPRDRGHPILLRAFWGEEAHVDAQHPLSLPAPRTEQRQAGAQPFVSLSEQALVREPRPGDFILAHSGSARDFAPFHLAPVARDFLGNPRRVLPEQVQQLPPVFFGELLVFPDVDDVAWFHLVFGFFLAN
mmetsp:Transcript_4426/g.10827  ORF Transcript_4426/g.10827 Transcript_4426/m.10827 type:complete len:211 (-) Transcript_4426:258-890(-)